MLRLALIVVALALGSGAAASAAPPTGAIKGTVIFEGEAPDRPILKRDSDPYCDKGEHRAEDVVVTKGKLAGVLVRIKNGTAPKVEGAAAPPPALIDQRDCTYMPRVVGVVAGQKLAVRNSDGTFHNVRGVVGGKPIWNKPAPPKSADLALDAAKADDVIEVVCDVHPWMHAYAVVQDHPYFAVTGEDGAFELRGLPPGTYTVEAWHPTLGLRTLTVKLGVGPKGTVPARFSFKAP